MKRRQPKRFWDDAREKVDAERRCRICKQVPYHLEAAHIIGREHDLPPFAQMHPGFDLYVNPNSVIALCGSCHGAYDRHEQDVLHTLSLDEQLQAVLDAGSVESMRRRTAPLAYRREAA